MYKIFTTLISQLYLPYKEINFLLFSKRNLNRITSPTAEYINNV